MGAAALSVLATPRTVQAQQVVDRVIASVDGEPLTMQELKLFASVNKLPLPDPGDMSAPTTKAALKQLIEERMLRREAAKFSYRIGNDRINAYIHDFERRAGLSNQQLRAELQAQGVTYQQFREHARLELEKMMMINQDVRSKVNITPAEIKAYYDAHRDEFVVTKERYKLAQILIALPPNPSPAAVQAALKKAEMIRKHAVNGGDFGILAHEYSDDASKSKGGELGYFSRGEVLDPIQNAVDHMKVGQISEPVRTVHGFHILKLEADDKPGVKPLAEVSESIRNKLMNEKTKELFTKWVNTELIKQHYVETLN